VRYVLWLKEVARGNLGYSLVNREPVLDRIARRLLPTIQLMGTALLLGVVIGVPLGVLSAIRRYSFLDHFVTVLAFLGVSSPSFFLGLGAIYLLSLKLDLLPTAGMQTLGAPYSLLDRLHHLILPALVAATGGWIGFSRIMRFEMLEVLNQDYVRTARSKGLAERAVIIRHVMRNALLPFVTGLSGIFLLILSGSILFEIVFSWPGMGRLFITALNSRDYPVMMALFVIGSFLGILGVLMVDILYSFVDPRVKYDVVR